MHETTYICTSQYAVHNSGPKCTQIQILKPEKLKTQNKSLMVKVHTVKYITTKVYSHHSVMSNQ